MKTQVAVYVRFLTVSNLFIRMNMWPNRDAAAESENAKLPGARLAEDAEKRLQPVLAENEFADLTWWQEVTPETEGKVVATD